MCRKKTLLRIYPNYNRYVTYILYDVAVASRICLTELMSKQGSGGDQRPKKQGNDQEEWKGRQRPIDAESSMAKRNMALVLGFVGTR
jgi:hypothetical protein